jgi:hypothetical protein
MCRSIKTLHNFEPPATDEEIRAASLQFVRKLSGFRRPSLANEPAFNRAVEQVTQAARELLDALVSNAPARDRQGGTQSGALNPSGLSSLRRGRLRHAERGQLRGVMRSRATPCGGSSTVKENSKTPKVDSDQRS